MDNQRIPAPSGLFPGGPPRPAYREPHPVRAGGVIGGLIAGALWLVLFGSLGGGLRGFGWWTLVAGGAAWSVALTLARSGDRGVAVGVALATGVGWAATAGSMVTGWAAGDWPLW